MERVVEVKSHAVNQSNCRVVAEVILMPVIIEKTQQSSDPYEKWTRA